ncbi:MAG: sigma-70 family RNA polymerase sigma factor [Polyangiaceae bacterium]|nr:sigma-70 family RNA polymerase sigma factor [Polyangiaceae bacterium]
MSCLEDNVSAVRHDELADLAAAAERGEPVALRTLLTTIMPLLLRVVRRVLGPGHPELEDVAFQAAHAVLEGLPRFRREGTLRHYACRVAAFTAMNVRRSEAAEKRSHRREHFDVDLCAAGGPGPEQEAASASLTPIVRELVATLPQMLAESLMLHVVLGYTVEEIAQACGVPGETVRSRLRLARRALRKRVLSSPTLLEALEVGS